MADLRDRCQRTRERVHPRPIVNSHFKDEIGWFDMHSMISVES